MKLSVVVSDCVDFRKSYQSVQVPSAGQTMENLEQRVYLAHLVPAGTYAPQEPYVPKASLYKPSIFFSLTKCCLCLEIV